MAVRTRVRLFLAIGVVSLALGAVQLTTDAWPTAFVGFGIASNCLVSAAYWIRHPDSTRPDVPALAGALGTTAGILVTGLLRDREPVAHLMVAFAIILSAVDLFFLRRALRVTG